MHYFGSILAQIERRMKLSQKQDTHFLDAKMMQIHKKYQKKKLTKILELTNYGKP